MKAKTILITGGEGMIGMELRGLLHEYPEYDIRILDIKNGDDIRDYQRCLELCRDVDIVFHLFGIKGSPKMTKESPVDFMGPMLQGDTNMILAAVQSGVKKFLYTSSIAVENPETDVYPAWAKMTGEKLIEAMGIQYPHITEFVIVRPANVYGKYDNFKNPNAMVITSLINKALDNSIEVWGDGSEIRDFIHARDVARGMIQAIEQMPNRPVNLCSGKGISIKKIAETIGKITHVNVEYDKSKKSGDAKRVMKLNWRFRPEIEIEEGIREVIHFRVMELNDG